MIHVNGKEFQWEEGLTVTEMLKRGDVIVAPPSGDRQRSAGHHKTAGRLSIPGRAS
jgi:hypothetical protein